MSRYAEPRPKGRDLTSWQRGRRQTVGDLLWAVAPALSGALGVTGLVLLAAGVIEWLTTSHWASPTLYQVLLLVGFAETSSSYILLDHLTQVPLGLVLVLLAPAIFLILINLAEWLETDSLFRNRLGSTKGHLHVSHDGGDGSANRTN